MTPAMVSTIEIYGTDMCLNRKFII